jgi:hypothetical protein
MDETKYTKEDEQEAIRIMEIWAKDGLWMLACNFFGAKLDARIGGFAHEGFWEAVAELTPKLYAIRNPTEEELSKGKEIGAILMGANRQVEYEERTFRNRASFQSEDMQNKLWNTYRENDRHYQGLENWSKDLDSQLNSIGCGLVLKE